ncbi:Sugar phosphate isomerase/epimerase [Spirosomataceae bacterium TFI 002]|nr:Sugar phosphate isomerase/epimerase [Spirosomataceae bacterium TFI 002]
MEIKRRSVIKSLFLSPMLTIKTNGLGKTQNIPKRKLSLNAFSFNKQLINGDISLEDLLVWCNQQGFDGIDITGYYFKNYPNVPSDMDIYKVKRLAHSLGLSISGTGVRNDFSLPSFSDRVKEIELVKNWVDVAHKLGAPVLRIFSGKKIPDGHTWKQVADWMITDIKTCVQYAQEKGVIIGLQNHNEFIKTLEQYEYIQNGIGSNWFGLVLDIGSFRQGNSYKEIQAAIPYAVNWQLKERMYINGQEQKTDYKKLMEIIKSSSYQGFLPIETLGEGDPKVKVKQMLSELKPYW